MMMGLRRKSTMNSIDSTNKSNQEKENASKD